MPYLERIVWAPRSAAAQLDRLHPDGDGCGRLSCRCIDRRAYSLPVLNQALAGAFRNTSYRPPSDTALLRPRPWPCERSKPLSLPGRREEFEERTSRAKRWLLSAKPFSIEERSMPTQRAGRRGRIRSGTRAFVKALKSNQNQDGSWSQLPGVRPKRMPRAKRFTPCMFQGMCDKRSRLQKGVEWLLRNQLADGCGSHPRGPCRCNPIRSKASQTAGINSSRKRIQLGNNGVAFHAPDKR